MGQSQSAIVGPPGTPRNEADLPRSNSGLTTPPGSPHRGPTSSDATNPNQRIKRKSSRVRPCMPALCCGHWPDAAVLCRAQREEETGRLRPLMLRATFLVVVTSVRTLPPCRCRCLSLCRACRCLWQTIVPLMLKVGQSYATIQGIRFPSGATPSRSVVGASD